MQHERLRYTRPAQYVAGASMLLRWCPAPANLLASDPQSLRICAALSSDLRPHCSIAPFRRVRANWVRKSVDAYKLGVTKRVSGVETAAPPAQGESRLAEGGEQQKEQGWPFVGPGVNCRHRGRRPTYRRASAVLAQRQRTRRREHSGYLRLILSFRMFI